MKIQTLLSGLEAAGFRFHANAADTKNATQEVEVFVADDFVVTIQAQGKHYQGRTAVAGYAVQAQSYRLTRDIGWDIVWESEEEWLTTAEAVVSAARKYRKGYEAQAKQEAKWEAEYEAAMKAAQYAEV